MAELTKVWCPSCGHRSNVELAMAERKSFNRICPSCDYDGTCFDGTIKGTRVTGTACEDKCETAKSNVCKCSCGGMAHGIRS
jgi:hypothetical protein